MRRNTYPRLVLVVLIFFVCAYPANADRIDELKEEIAEKSSSISNIEKDIAQYRAQLSRIGGERRTLESTIRELDISRDKVQADINSTQEKISSAELTIELLGLEIEEKEAQIKLNNHAIAQVIRSIHEADSQTLVESILGYENLSEFWSQADTLDQFKTALGADLKELAVLKAELEEKQIGLRVERDHLAGLRSELTGQRLVIEANISEKDELLSETKSEEASYQALLNEKLRLKAAFEAELRAAEEQLRIEIDPSRIPNSGSGVLAWPLDNVVITQYFGNTSFATANPQIYSGGGHNGIDLSAPIGTKVKAALSGTIEAVGDTDTACRNASYGKWVLIRHNNGLTTLYAHLSVISVAAGQTVETGGTIGFSGNTGFSTGPHLHFTVFATQGVKVGTLASKVCGTTYTLPIADRSAYLNPLSYL